MIHTAPTVPNIASASPTHDREESFIIKSCSLVMNVLAYWTMAAPLQPSPYLDNLRSLPFVRSVGLRADRPRSGPAAAAVLELTTPRGKAKLRVEEKTSHLTLGVARDIIARVASRPTPPLILFAPYVSAEMAAVLLHQGINFVDKVGNCHLNLGGSYVAHVEGHKMRRPLAAPGGMRAPGFRLVFALLVEPELLNSPTRHIAQAAGVSLGTASNVLRRLEHDRMVVRTKSRRQLVRPDDLIERWIAGYAETLRPQIFLGRFHTPDKDPPSLEDRVAALLGRDWTWAWGGAAAAFRLTKHYRSDETVLHVEAATSDLPKRLKALPHRAGRLILLGVPGPLAFRGNMPRTVHPLLIYTELVLTGSDRAREAASELRERFLSFP